MTFPLIEISWLKTFVEVAQTGSMTEATKTRFRSQSAISMHIKNIESVLGNKVFYRDARKLTLTPLGHELVLHVRQILGVYDHAMQSLMGSDIQGTISLGIPDDYAIKYLPRVLQTFSEKYPLIEINLLCEPSSTLIPKVENNELDIAIVTRDHAKRGDYLFSEEMVWVGSDAYPIWHKTPLPVAIYEFGSRIRKEMIQVLDTVQGGYRIVYNSSYVAGQLAAVESGMAIAVLSQCCVPDKLRILNNEGLPALPKLDVAVIHSQSHQQQALVDLLINDIKTLLTA